MSPRTALVFPGQGSQRIGMLDDLPEHESLPRLLDAAEALSGFGLRTIAEQGPEERLADTRCAQPLLYLADWAWGRALIDSGVNPEAVAGHSLGELAALAIAGVFSVEAGLELVVERSKFMATAARENPGTMAAVIGLDNQTVRTATENIEGVWVANDNGPGQVVISGTLAGVAEASAALSEAGARRIVPLSVAGPFHSPLMDDARARFAAILGSAAFADARMPVYQNTNPSPATAGEVIRQRLATQIVEPVRWTETMNALAAAGFSLLVEAGPGGVLTGLARRVEGLTGIAAETAGVEGVLEEVSA
jgi:[acyl-carrier-protein] S-malonyltransferase